MGHCSVLRYGLVLGFLVEHRCSATWCASTVDTIRPSWSRGPGPVYTDIHVCMCFLNQRLQATVTANQLLPKSSNQLKVYMHKMSRLLVSRGLTMCMAALVSALPNTHTMLPNGPRAPSATASQLACNCLSHHVTQAVAAAAQSAYA